MIVAAAIGDVPVRAMSRERWTAADAAVEQLVERPVLGVNLDQVVDYRGRRSFTGLAH